MALLRRVLLALGRWLGVPLRAGRWTRGSAFSAQGQLRVAPLAIPRRDYLVYEPRGYTRWRRMPLIVLCHGCKQTPEAFAQGTAIAAAADARGWVVLMPRQRESANAWSCWNWFDSATAGGGGEAAIVAAMTRKAIRRHHVDSSRVFAAGMSAGGALAAILGIRHPQLFRGVAVHSGMACGAASSAFTATSVMARGPDVDVAAIGSAAHDPRQRVALLAIHGMADNVVAPRNAAALVRQYLALNGYPLAAADLPRADVDHSDAGARPTRIRDWRDQQGVIARLVEIDGLQHAWSGGDATLPFNDDASPVAVDLIDEWLRDLASHSAKIGNPAGDEQ